MKGKGENEWEIQACRVLKVGAADSSTGPAMYKGTLSAFFYTVLSLD